MRKVRIIRLVRNVDITGATADDEAGNVGEIEGVADSYPNGNASAEGVLDESLPPSADDAVPVDGG
jgi:hypothetical protein